MLKHWASTTPSTYLLTISIQKARSLVQYSFLERRKEFIHCPIR